MIPKIDIDKNKLIITVKHVSPKETIVYTFTSEIRESKMDNIRLTTNEDKLAFAIEYLSLSNNEIASKFGVTSGTISKMKNPYESTLKPAYLYAFESAYGIPYKIFEDKKVNTSEKIIHAIKEKKKKTQTEVFYQNDELLNLLVGDWYAYLYPSNPIYDIYTIKTTIKSDGTVIDDNNNGGKLYLGKRQSMIIKESRNSQDLVSITFDNMQIPFGMFSFTLVSKRNLVHRKMCNFGFFSKRKLPLDKVAEILGDREDVQFKLDYGFEERINEFVGFEG
jgi:transcriptional regulator with XRE-family HTH domain